MKTKQAYALLHCIIIIYILCISISCETSLDKKRDHLVFRYNEHSNIASLDPAFSRDIPTIWATNQLFNGLTQLDEALAIQPDIAKHWTISDDALTYTFTLRDDVRFHKHPQFKTKDSTRYVTAHDFVYSFDRLTDADIASPGNWVLQNVATYTAVNAHTLSIQLKKPFPAFLGLLSMRYCSVVPHEIVNFYKEDFRANPIGTGPFQLKRWEENVKLVFRKNPLYYEKDSLGQSLPYLEAVAITFLPDKQSEFLQFAQGKIDILNSLDASYKDELLTSSGQLRAPYKKNVNLTKGAYLNTEYLGFFMDSSHQELQSKALRKAVNYGFDRQKMIAYLKNGIGTPAIHGFIPKGLPGFTMQKGFTYQPEKAEQYIEQYKEETGDLNPKITITTDGNYLSICEFIQRELEKIGISITIDVLPTATIREQKWNGQLDVFRASWIADYPDAENFLSPYYSKNCTPHGPNYTHFRNATFDQLYESSFSISDPKQRAQQYHKMDSILIAEAPIVPLYYDQVVRFTQKTVRGLTSNPQNFLVLKKVYKVKK